MSAPWLDHIPSAAEVEAHEAAHGVQYGGVRLGLWMLREEHEPTPLCGELQIGRGGNEGWNYLWSPHIGEHEGGGTVLLGPGDRVCPLTADGLPVALVTEAERLRARTTEADERGERLFVACSKALDPDAMSPAGSETELAEGIAALRTQHAETLRRVRVAVGRLGVADCDDPVEALEELVDETLAIATRLVRAANDTEAPRG